MTLGDYQKKAATFMNGKLDVEEQKAHSLFGLVSEVGELMDIYQKFLQGHREENVEEHQKKEVGDILWMIAEFCTTNGWNLDEIAQKNIDKLTARYPFGFDAYHSIHRKDGDV